MRITPLLTDIIHHLLHLRCIYKSTLQTGHFTVVRDQHISFADQLLGTHDFATFGTDPDEGGSTVRTVSVAHWSSRGPELTFDIQAEAFLYRMVRSIVGALKQVGAGEMTPAEFERVLHARDRSQCPPLAPAHGLCLMEVLYS